jgi:hypothetical protein
VIVDEVRALLGEWDEASRERKRDAVLASLDALSAIAPGSR